MNKLLIGVGLLLLFIFGTNLVVESLYEQNSGVRFIDKVPAYLSESAERQNELRISFNESMEKRFD